MGDVARLLLGEPPRVEADHTWRYGHHGSLAVHTAGDRRGTFRDFEAGVGGGTLALVEHVLQTDRANALRWLSDASLIAPSASVRRRETAPLPHSNPPESGTDDDQKSGHRTAPLRQDGTWTPWKASAQRSGTIRSTSATTDVARTIIRVSVPADDTPARAHLAARWTWPPRGIGPNLPPTVRWLPVAAIADLPAWIGANGKPRRMVLPRGASGVLVYLYARHGTLAAAVSLEAVTAAGERTSPRWRRAFGVRADTVFEACQRPGGAVWLVEGEADALTLAIAGYGGVVRAVGGTAGYCEAATDDVEQRPVVLVPDADRAGASAVVRLLAGLPGRTVRLAPWPAPAAGDPAAWLADLLTERAGIREHNGGQEPATAAAGAWHDLTAAAQRGADPLHLEAR